MTDLTLTIRPGEKVGLIGRSGAGKSTLVKLLLRFYDPERGTIAIDGQDIDAASRRTACATPSAWCSRIRRCCTARSPTTSATAARTRPTPRCEAAAAQGAGARLHPRPVRTRRGAPATTPRWASAASSCRAGSGSASRSPASSSRTRRSWCSTRRRRALDSEVEAAIQDTLYGMMEGKTVIAIAHRLSTIAAMDRIVVIDDGRIVEEATHDELLAPAGSMRSSGRANRADSSTRRPPNEVDSSPTLIDPFARADGPAAAHASGVPALVPPGLARRHRRGRRHRRDAGRGGDRRGRHPRRGDRRGARRRRPGSSRENWPLLLGATAFFVLLRPVLVGASGLVQSVVVGPAVYQRSSCRACTATRWGRR